MSGETSYPNAVAGPAAAAAARETRIGYACAVSVLFVWAGFLLSSRLSASQSLTPWDVAMLRYVGAFLAALPLAAVLGWPRLPPLRLAALLASAGFGFPILAYHGFTMAPAAHGGVMLPGTLPFLTALLGVLFLGESWTRRRVQSLAVVALGILLLAGDTFGDHPGAWRGDLLFLCGSLGWATYTILIRHWRIGALQATLSIALWSAPVYLPVWWLLLPSTLEQASLGGALYQMAYQGLGAVILAGLLFTRAVTALGGATTTSITALVPGIAALAAWPLLGEPLGWVGFLGVGLVCLGMILMVVRLPERAR